MDLQQRECNKPLFAEFIKVQRHQLNAGAFSFVQKTEKRKNAINDHLNLAVDFGH